jgi:hypothetical protein
MNRLYLALALSTLLMLGACQKEEVDTRPALYTRVLTCETCGYSGIGADIWESPQLAKVQCRVPWDTVVEVVTEDEPMSEVRTLSTDRPNCTGWVSNDLLQPAP